MSKDLLPILAGVGLAGATGGLSGLGAAGVGAEGGAAALGAGMAGDALAAQGAAGLLGSAGAAAAGYAAPAMGVGASGIASGISNGGTAAFGNNGEFVGNTIESELTANPYTGGFDSLNGFERMGQRVGGLMDDGSFNKLGDIKRMIGGQQQQQPQDQNREISGGAVQGMSQPSNMGAYVYNQGQPNIQEIERQRRMMMNGGGYFG